MDTNELIPAGQYRARGVSAQLGFTNADKEQVAISFALLQPGFEGQHMPYYGTFSEKALEHTLKALRACGWKGVDLSDLSGIDANEVVLVIEHETFEGVTRAKVKWVNDGTAGLLKKVMDPAAAKSFAQRMRGAIATADASRPAPGAKPAAKPVARPEPPPLTDADAPRGGANDIPF